MNLPVGTVVEKNLQIKELDIIQKTRMLMNEGFTGYCVLTIEGCSGIEEGILLFKKGKVVGAIFEYNRFEVNVFGDFAAKQFFNASKAEYGLMDVCALTSQQVDLITAFNEKILLSIELNPKNLNKLVPNQYESKYAEEVLAGALKKQESKYDVFKKFGLTGIR